MFSSENECLLVFRENMLVSSFSTLQEQASDLVFFCSDLFNRKWHSWLNLRRCFIRSRDSMTPSRQTWR
jgi:hypothetical protein